MKPPEKPRSAVIIIRPSAGLGRLTTWETICGECGPEKAAKTKDAATKKATQHSKEHHGGEAVVKIRQA